MKTIGPKEVNRKCPKCGSPLVERFSPKTRKSFIGCSNYPTCKYCENADGTPQEPPVILDEICPLCGKHLLLRTSHSGNKFIGCSGFPKCHYMRSPNMTDEQYQTIRKIISEEKLKKNKHPADALPEDLRKLYLEANATRFPKKKKEEKPVDKKKND
jgi:ssDNA-binding Zn-finger/Zn-ribbon topoisomerase 1